MLGVKQPAVSFAFGVYHNSSLGNITLGSALGLEARRRSGWFSLFPSPSLSRQHPLHLRCSQAASLSRPFVLTCDEQYCYCGSGFYTAAEMVAHRFFSWRGSRSRLTSSNTKVLGVYAGPTSFFNLGGV